MSDHLGRPATRHDRPDGARTEREPPRRLSGAARRPGRIGCSNAPRCALLCSCCLTLVGIIGALMWTAVPAFQKFGLSFF